MVNGAAAPGIRAPDSGIVRAARRADNDLQAPGAAPLADMRIGDPLTYQGRRYVLRGLDPMGVPDRRADLEDTETGELIRVPLAELGAARDCAGRRWLH